MAERDDYDKRTLMKWEWAAGCAKRHNRSPMIQLLRELYRPDEVPDLQVIADILEEKKRKKGRPRADESIIGSKLHRVGMIQLLRDSYRPYDIPDLSVLADLLEGEKPYRGRPRIDKITNGLKQLKAAIAVEDGMQRGKISIEAAIENAADTLHMSAPAVKKAYFMCKKHNLVRTSGRRKKSVIRN